MVENPRRQDFSNPRYAAAARDLLSLAMVRPLKPLVEAIAKADPARESPAESLTTGYLYLSGLPMPLFQDAIRETDHRVLRWMGRDPMVRPALLIARIAAALGC